MTNSEKKLIEEFAEFIAMSFDKGMRMIIAMTRNETEKFKIKAIYSQFIDSLPKCLEAFAEWKKFEKEKK